VNYLRLRRHVLVVTSAGHMNTDGRPEARDVGALYRDEGPAIYAYLRRVVRDEEDACDLLQETFRQAMRFPERLGACVSARAWLFGVARNLAMNSVRRRRPAPPLPADVAEPPETEDPRVEQMREAIARLPEPMRETLQLRLGEELSYQEVAAALGVPVGTVRSRIHNAVKLLRDRMTGRQG